MKILHIGYVNKHSLTGVSLVIPEHLKYQSEYAEVAFVNFASKENLPELENQYHYTNFKEFLSYFDHFGKCDLVVFHEVYNVAYLRIYHFLRKRRVPYVIIPHGCLSKFAQKVKPLKKKIGNFVFWPFIKNSQAIQCLSLNESNSIVFTKKKERFIGTNGIVIPSKRKTCFNKDSISFVFIGRLDPFTKGIDLLIEAINCNSAFLRKNNCKFFIYGPYNHGWEKQIKGLINAYDLGGLVFLNDQIRGEEKEQVLLSSDIFIQTSRSEGMPVGILEALGYGLPVFITKGTNLTELVEKYNAGFTCETNVEAISELLLKVVNKKKDYNNMSLNSINLVKERFSWEIVCKDTIENYKRIVKEYK